MDKMQRKWILKRLVHIATTLVQRVKIWHVHTTIKVRQSRIRRQISVGWRKTIGYRGPGHIPINGHLVDPWLHRIRFCENRNILKRFHKIVIKVWCSQHGQEHFNHAIFRHVNIQLHFRAWRYSPARERVPQDVATNHNSLETRSRSRGEEKSRRA